MVSRKTCEVWALAGFVEVGLEEGVVFVEGKTGVRMDVIGMCVISEVGNCIDRFLNSIDTDCGVIVTLRRIIAEMAPTTTHKLKNAARHPARHDERCFLTLNLT
jgi:hypothetical protein